MRVRVCFPFRAHSTYDYTVPKGIVSVAPGMRVVAPLGSSQRHGYIVSCNPPEEPGVRYRDIVRIVDDAPVITEDLISLATFMSQYYDTAYGVALNALLPGPVRTQTQDAIHVHVVRACMSSAELTAEAESCARRAPSQARALRHIAGHYREHDAETFPLRLSTLVSRAEVTTAVIRALEKKQFISVTCEPFFYEEDATSLPSGMVTLTEAQSDAVDAILARRNTFAPFVLYGVTGSGKTEVYLRVIREILEAGQTALVLVPEIALTPQTVERFRARFATRVAVQHSNLSRAERSRQWWEIREGHVRIVVGARSAVFAPLPHLGMIVVDEEHESSYKQNDPAPRYHARDVAVMRAKIAGCPIILGSATPSLESYANAREGKYELLTLSERVGGAKVPVPQLVDLRVEQRVAPQFGVLSRALREAIGETLSAGEQTVLFLNRRGYAPIMLCNTCGYVKTCELCAVSLTYHATTQSMKCHLCGHSESYSPPYVCPSCHARLSVVGVGTQRIEAVVNAVFPHARVGRMDRDTTTARDSHNRILTAFGRGEYDILLGTQMIAKGLDYPNVTLVGVINADTGLHAPDFRATETTFQLITQVAGRAGRGAKPGRVIVQSFAPESAPLQHAIKGEYTAFAAEELAARKEVLYPPFRHFIHVILRGKKEEDVALAAGDITGLLRTAAKKHLRNRGFLCDVHGPAPAPLSRAHGYYRWQAIVRTGQVIATLEKVIRPVMKMRQYRGVTVYTDVDPY